MPSPTSVLKPITNPQQIKLADEDAARPDDLPKGDELKKTAKRERKRLKNLQNVLYADARYAVLIVIQGRDASGKDGTVRKVFRSINPMGCEVTSFKVPTETELAHDFLWRIHKRVPAHRMIGIFNRSHYEDVIVARVHKHITRATWESRYDQINEFEHILTRNNVVILKFCLHVSRKEQKKRLEERLEDPEKNWKFRVGDLDDRELWDDFTAAYHDAIANCSTDWAPWYVVPADDEDARDYLIANKIADTLDGLGLEYPKLEKGLKKIEIE